MIVSDVYDHQQRLKSFELIAELVGERETMAEAEPSA